MPNSIISNVSFLVRDYDEASLFFTQVLGFSVIEDRQLHADKRWLVVGPSDQFGAKLLLAKATTPEQIAQIGRQSAGRVFLFLETDDFWGTYHHLASHSVRFAEKPREEEYGTVVVFLDLYGNKWDLIGRFKSNQNEQF